MAHFSLLKYDYLDKSILSHPTGYYLRSPVINIGDIIQSIAARQYLPHVSSFIDRDGIAYAHDINTNIILNGWFHIYDGNRLIPESFNALVVSMYLRNSPAIPQSFINSLKRYEPIGARDVATKEFLRSNGVHAYFSSCLTTTLSRTYQCVEPRKGVVFVDFNLSESNEKWNRKIINLLSQYDCDNINYIRHTYDARINNEDLFEIGDRLLKIYANAKLVITTRLHCALPCLSFGTPVILVTPSFDLKRFSGLENFLNITGNHPDKGFIWNVEMQSGEVVNKDLHIGHAKSLEDRCIEFVNKAMM